jgi:rfaE bifunctional protein kinase chain/domain
MKIDNILHCLSSVSDCSITVFGDYCLDKYLYIDPKRDEVSVETGLTAHQSEKRVTYPGAAGTIVQNLCALGVKVCCVGLVGLDGEGFDLLKGLSSIGADTELMIRTDKVVTSTYMKPMRKLNGGRYIEMNRIDIRNFEETPATLEDQLIANLEKAISKTQAIVVSDQFLQRNCSAVTDKIRCKLEELANLHADKIFYADSRGFAEHYRNVIIKCNQHELPKSQKMGECIQERAKELMLKIGHAVVVTVGEEGAYVCQNNDITLIPAIRVEGPIDIVGAGDAVNAGIILGLALKLTLPEAVLLGICCATITIQQLGVTGTATVKQVRQQLLKLQ